MSIGQSSLFHDWRLWVLGIALIVAFAIDFNRCHSEDRNRENARRANLQKPPSDRDRDRDPLTPDSLSPRQPYVDPSTIETIYLELVGLTADAIEQCRPELRLIHLGNNLDNPPDFRRQMGSNSVRLRSRHTTITVPKRKGCSVLSISGDGIMTTYCVLETMANGGPEVVHPYHRYWHVVPEALKAASVSIPFGRALGALDSIIVDQYAVRGFTLSLRVTTLTEVRLSSTATPGILAAAAKPTFAVTLPDRFEVLPKRVVFQPPTEDVPLATMSFRAPLGATVMAEFEPLAAPFQSVTLDPVGGEIVLTQFPQHVVDITAEGVVNAAIHVTFPTVDTLPVLRCRTNGANPWEIPLVIDQHGIYHFVCPKFEADRLYQVVFFAEGYQPEPVTFDSLTKGGDAFRLALVRQR